MVKRRARPKQHIRYVRVGKKRKGKKPVMVNRGRKKVKRAMTKTYFKKGIGFGGGIPKSEQRALEVAQNFGIVRNIADKGSPSSDEILIYNNNIRSVKQAPDNIVRVIDNMKKRSLLSQGTVKDPFPELRGGVDLVKAQALPDKLVPLSRRE